MKNPMDIDFCECGGMLVPAGAQMRCRLCEKIVNKTMKGVKIVSTNEKKELMVFENNAPDLPTTEKECEECKNDRAYFWIIQTRSSDEPPTRFFRCTECKHTWREYQ